MIRRRGSRPELTTVRLGKVPTTTESGETGEWIIPGHGRDEADRAHKVPISGTWTRFPRIVIELDTLARPAHGTDGRAGWRAPSLEWPEGVMSAQV